MNTPQTARPKRNCPSAYKSPANEAKKQKVADAPATSNVVISPVDTDARLRRTEDENGELKAALAAAQQELAITKQELAAEQANVEELCKQHAAMEQELHAVAPTTMDVPDDDALKAQVEALLKEINDLKAQNTDLDTHNEALLKVNVDLNKDVQKVQERNDELTAQKEDLAAQLMDAMDDVRKMTETMTYLSNEVDRLSQKEEPVSTTTHTHVERAQELLHVLEETGTSTIYMIKGTNIRVNVASIDKLMEDNAFLDMVDNCAWAACLAVEWFGSTETEEAKALFGALYASDEEFWRGLVVA